MIPQVYCSGHYLKGKQLVCLDERTVNGTRESALHTLCKNFKHISSYSKPATRRYLAASAVLQVSPDRPTSRSHFKQILSLSHWQWTHFCHHVLVLVDPVQELFWHHYPPPPARHRPNPPNPAVNAIPGICSFGKKPLDPVPIPANSDYVNIAIINQSEANSITCLKHTPKSIDLLKRISFIKFKFFPIILICLIHHFIKKLSRKITLSGILSC